ncbi:MAG: hypothetical protein IPP67_08910 [Rhodospirillaceae bacterium]|nr:hypothetical protein [Rhodospirillaceae bacterium]
MPAYFLPARITREQSLHKLYRHQPFQIKERHAQSLPIMFGVAPSLAISMLNVILPLTALCCVEAC